MKVLIIIAFLILSISTNAQQLKWDRVLYMDGTSDKLYTKQILEGKEFRMEFLNVNDYLIDDGHYDSVLVQKKLTGILKERHYTDRMLILFGTRRTYKDFVQILDVFQRILLRVKDDIAREKYGTNISRSKTKDRLTRSRG